jgi:hypothetical protein
MTKLNFAFTFVALCLAQAATAADAPPKKLSTGPYLLLDDRLFSHVIDVERKVMQPQRFLDKPVITSGPEHQHWQMWFTAIHDPARPPQSRFRIWYDADTIDDPADRPDAIGPVMAYLESADGIKWPGPYKRLDLHSVMFGGCVLDGGPDFTPANERFKVIYYSNGRGGTGAGPVVAFSPDGLKWTNHNGGKPVLDLPLDDSWHATYDSVRKRYVLIGKHLAPYTWTNAEGKQVTQTIRRFGVSFSQDFRTWTPLKLVFEPDNKDPGVTQWYAATGYQHRGDTILAFLQVLRDDLTAEGAPPEAVAANLGNAGAGMGYTVLAWSHDGGETWHRDRHTDKYFEPDPKVGAWDHAMGWISTSTPVGDETYLYYAGIRWGHKYQRSIDRQIGLLKVKRDRYVARKAGAQGGLLMTHPLTLTADAMTINAVVENGGEIRVQVADTLGKAFPGFDFASCQPIRDDTLAARVSWKGGSLKELGDQAVVLQFSIRNAALYAFELTDTK